MNMYNFTQDSFYKKMLNLQQNKISFGNFSREMREKFC